LALVSQSTETAEAGNAKMNSPIHIPSHLQDSMDLSFERLRVYQDQPTIHELEEQTNTITHTAEKPFCCWIVQGLDDQQLT
jgi:hypothetical protein